MSAKIRHTKSTSGRTHRLTVTRHMLYGVDVQAVTIRYVTAPRFDDQVQGDLIRKFCREVASITVGIVPDSPRIDPQLDITERPTAEEIAAEVCPDGYAFSARQMQQRVAEAIQAERDHWTKYFQENA